LKYKRHLRSRASFLIAINNKKEDTRIDKKVIAIWFSIMMCVAVPRKYLYKDNYHYLDEVLAFFVFLLAIY